MSRLATIIRRILRAERTTGAGIIVGEPGSLRISGRSERVLIAGNAIPQAGARVAWARVDGNTLLVPYSRRGQPTFLPGARASFRWEQVLVNSYAFNTRISLAHRDSLGGHWICGRRFLPDEDYWFYRAADQFTTANWSVLVGIALDPGVGLAYAGHGDLVMQTAYSYSTPPGTLGMVVWQTDIDPVAATLAHSAAHVLPGAYLTGGIWGSSIVRDSDGYWHVAINWDEQPIPPNPPGSYQRREIIWRSDAPDSADAWTQTLDATHTSASTFEGMPILARCGENLVLLWSSDTINLQYRVYGGAWGDLQDAGFRAVSISARAIGDEFYMAFTASDGSAQWRSGRIEGGSIVWTGSGLLITEAAGHSSHAVQSNFGPESDSVGIWAHAYDSQDLYYIGLPEEEIVPSVVQPLGYSLEFYHLAAADGIAGQDGFAAFVEGNRYIYAARVVAE